MDAISLKPIGIAYVQKESYDGVLPLFTRLHQQRLRLRAITVDGHRFVMAALKTVWPRITLQRCLFHIQRQGLSWIRTKPKTTAGQQIQALLKGITQIRTLSDKHAFEYAYRMWHEQHRDFVRSLPWNDVRSKDLKRTMGLLNNARPDMFHYLKDKKIRPTTNALEGFYSQLKRDFQRHRGLSAKHKISYLRWYCYFKQQKKSNT